MINVFLGAAAAIALALLASYLTKAALRRVRKHDEVQFAGFVVGAVKKWRTSGAVDVYIVLDNSRACYLATYHDSDQEFNDLRAQELIETIRAAAENVDDYGSQE